MRTVRWLGGAVWIGSWYLMYLEITRWHHVKPTLTLNSEISHPAGVQPHPGMPLLLLYLACVAAPFLVLVGTVLDVRRRRQPSH